MTIFDSLIISLQFRGTDIFSAPNTGEDGLPYFTLSYANGPGKFQRISHHPKASNFLFSIPSKQVSQHISTAQVVSVSTPKTST